MAQTGRSRPRGHIAGLQRPLEAPRTQLKRRLLGLKEGESPVKGEPGRPQAGVGVDKGLAFSQGWRGCGG